ncbi:MAG: gamma carbonic anhydrase family protein [Cytophagales bacterium]|nr:gamma carbonic anhydrase family protein [Cytophagales bacterium]
MVLVKEIKGKTPVMGENCWLAENSTVVGDVRMGSDCTVWYSAVVRGDVNSITIGNRTNIQDGVVVHGTYEKAATVIGNDVNIGHNACVHGCEIRDRVLIGMNAVVMDNAVVESHVIVAAGSVVLANAHLESGYVYAGAPAKKVKKLTEEQMAVFERTAKNYVMYASWQ